MALPTTLAQCDDLTSKTSMHSRKYLGVSLADAMFVGTIAVATKASISRSTIYHSATTILVDASSCMKISYKHSLP